jgi:hypothetical protein
VANHVLWSGVDFVERWKTAFLVFSIGAGEGNRTLVISLGSCVRNGSTMRLCDQFSLHKIALNLLSRAAIHAAPVIFVER